VCTEPDSVPADPIQVFDETRIHIGARIHPALSSLVPALIDLNYAARNPQAGIEHAFYRSQLMSPRFRRTPVPDDGVNILITNEYGLNAAGEPYCLQLTARQGPRIWRRTISRPGLVEQLRGEIGMTPDGRSNDPNRYWNPFMDSLSLARSLGADLASHADPVYRLGRPRSRPTLPGPE
jgi:hypothetical protein